MTPLENLLASEIRRQGPIGFERFMEAALYHPEHGYYRQARDPFGFEGDFYTNSQMQPVFGRLLAQKMDAWRREMGSPSDFTVVEWGAGRGETLAEIKRCLPELETVAVEVGEGEMPERLTGVVLANEFFDALPVFSIERGREGLLERRVAWDGERFLWSPEPAGDSYFQHYVERYLPDLPWGRRTEVNRAALDCLGRIAERLEEGYLLAIDYGYTADEIVRAGRFAHGSLMSYRRHRFDEDVLAEPGRRDITSHVNFSALEIRARALGFVVEPLQSQTAFLMDIGEPDDFQAALRGDRSGDLDRRRKLKNLLFGLGETFRVFVARKS